MRVIRQNLFWAFIYNVIGIPLAAGVLYPVFGLLLSPVIASALWLSALSVSSPTACGSAGSSFHEEDMTAAELLSEGNETCRRGLPRFNGYGGDGWAWRLNR